MTTRQMPDETQFAKDLFNDYNEYAKVLRAWFVAYGIGGPVLLLTNAAIGSKIAASGSARPIGSAFLGGVGLQVLLALLNKSALWLYYKSERRPELGRGWGYRLAKWFAYEFWIDFSFDSVSFILLGWATWRAFSILIGAA
ncbi:MAG: hypothetical protein ACREPM_15860 [Gemmatimonadaceae bacterium]